MGGFGREMSDRDALEDLVDHLARTSPLTRAQAARCVEEVLAFLDEPAEAYLVRRHRELQAEGLANDAIFARLAEEVARRRFRAPAYSARQIRRIIYG